MRWLRQWWPAMAWAAAIFFFSTGAFGGESTSRFIIPFLRWLLPDAPPETLFQLHFLIRKAGHFVEYFFLSLLVLRGLRGGAGGWRLRWGLAALLISTGYAATDEFHQYFVPSRGAAAQDVLLDAAGAAVAQAVARLWLGKNENRK
ncbi:MAG: VanZ family protein [Acidobacteria bacterium]|nr:VanZ family protein [Acidobacteriota bacterium]MBI3662247.1 VanZ family protein [Acidobacteriota bacterium]